MYSVMAIFNSSILWGLFEYTEYCNRQVHRDFWITLYLRCCKVCYVLWENLYVSDRYISLFPPLSLSLCLSTLCSLRLFQKSPKDPRVNLTIKI
jgi:hypothetical protein